MNATQLLNQLDSVSGSPDKVRIHAAMANNLRAAIQLQEQADALDKQIAAHRDWSLQGEFEYANLRERRGNLPDAPLAVAITQAETILNEWREYA